MKKQYYQSYNGILIKRFTKKLQYIINNNKMYILVFEIVTILIVIQGWQLTKKYSQLLSIFGFRQFFTKTMPRNFLKILYTCNQLFITASSWFRFLFLICNILYLVVIIHQGKIIISSLSTEVLFLLLFMLKKTKVARSKAL